MILMNKGAVPIPYIIALVLAIAVIALIGYWFFFLSGQWSGQVTETQCTTHAITYCSDWKLTGYSWDNEKNEPSIGSWEDTPGISECAALYGITMDQSSRELAMQGCESLVG
jgi:hypothetical protein